LTLLPQVLLYNSSIYVDTSQPGDGYEGFRSSGAFLILVKLLCRWVVWVGHSRPAAAWAVGRFFPHGLCG